MKTGRTVPELPLLRKTVNIYKILNLRKALNLCRTPDIRKILLPLDGRNRTYRVSKARKDKADKPVLDAEGVTVSPSTNAKG